MCLCQQKSLVSSLQVLRFIASRLQIQFLSFKRDEEEKKSPNFTFIIGYKSPKKERKKVKIFQKWTADDIEMREKLFPASEVSFEEEEKETNFFHSSSILRKISSRVKKQLDDTNSGYIRGY